MADLGKNGYSWTGYTEPFIIPEGVTLSSGARLDSISPIPIEKTEYKNSILYVRSNEDKSGTDFTSKDLNFDTRSDVNKNAWILDVNGTETIVSDVSYDNASKLYTIVVDTSVVVESGKAYRVIKRNIDVGNTLSTKSYTVGMKVTELYI